MGWPGTAQLIVWGTMSGPCVRIPFWVRVFLLLLFHRVSAGCPELLSSGCSCAEDRGKAHTAPGARRKVSCVGKELTETPEVSLLPNRTVSLWVFHSFHSLTTQTPRISWKQQIAYSTTMTLPSQYNYIKLMFVLHFWPKSLWYGLCSKLYLSL